MRNLRNNLIGAALVLLFGCTGSGLSQEKKERHIFLLIGQSNMAGRATIEDVDKEPIKGVFLWNIGEKKWEAAVPPYNLYSPSRKEVGMQRLNCGPTFAKAYLEKHPDVEVGIVCAARGGTSIKQWDREKPDQFDLYSHAVDATNAALTGGNGKLRGILWHQGEQDVDDKTVDIYPEKLAQLIGNLRSDLGATNLPFVYCQIGRWNPACAPFNEMIVRQPAAIPYSACVTAEKLKNFDQWHFDSASQRELGKRFAAALESLISKP